MRAIKKALQTETHQKTMLKQRIITALILVAILLVALMVPNPIFWRLFISIALFIGFWEWLSFCKVTDLAKAIPYYVLFVLFFAALQTGVIPMYWLVAISCLFWILLLCFTFKDVLTAFHVPWIKALIGIWVLSTSGYFVIELKSIENGALWILCMMIAIWAADVGAYFVGRRFGKTKLAPSISPGKTVEGLVGGLVLVLVLFVPLIVVNFDTKKASLLILTVLITALLSVCGDLFESKLKRYANLKDSSQILPGHGGVLDRIDSLLAGVPFFMFGLFLLGILT